MEFFLPFLGSHHTSQERQPAAVPELPNNKSPKQSHAEDHTDHTDPCHIAP